jgi:uncharacterized protein YjbI with pentapeptide repeats
MLKDKINFKKAIFPSIDPEKKERDLEKSITLLKSINEISKSLRPQFVGFLLVIAYLTVTISSITDFELLVGEGAKLPLIDTQVPLRFFFIFSPPLILIYHYQVLMQLLILARTAERFVRETHRFGKNRFFDRYSVDSFMLSYSIAGPERGIINYLISIPLVISAIILPPSILLLIQLKFLPYQSEFITWSHRIVIFIDLAILSYLTPLIFNFKATQRWRSKALDRAKKRQFHLTKTKVLIFSLVAPVMIFSWCIALIPLEPWENVVNYATTLGSRQKENEAIDPPMTKWFFFPIGTEGKRLTADNCLDKKELRLLHRSLDLCRRVLVSNTLKAEVHSDLMNYKPEALKQVERLILTGRNFRFANFQNSRLPLANLSENDFQGANFNFADLRFASLSGSNLKQAKFIRANLSGANITGGADRSGNMDYANFESAILTCSTFDADASSKNVTFINAIAAGASFSMRDFSGSNFSGANLLHTDFTAIKIDKNTKFDSANVFAAEILPLEEKKIDPTVASVISTQPSSDKLRAYSDKDDRTWERTFDFAPYKETHVPSCLKKLLRINVKIYPDNLNSSKTP